MTTKTAQVKNTTATATAKKTLSQFPLFFGFFATLFFMPKVGAQDITAPRFFEFNVQPNPASPASNLPQSHEGVLPQTHPGYKIQAALKFPIKLKGNTKVIGELKYKNEFTNGFYALDDNQFEQIELRQSKGSIIVLSQLNEKWRFTNVLSASSNSTSFISLNSNAMQFRNISMFEKELKNGATIGFGGSVTYDHSLTAIPIFKYETDFGKGWNLNMVLPKEIEVSKDLTKNSRLLFNVNGSGLNYTLSNNQIANELTPTSIYKRMDVAGTVGYERQITPWIGFSVHAGATMPISSGIYANDTNQTQLYKFNDGISPYFRVGVFVSFPR